MLDKTTPPRAWGGDGEYVLMSGRSLTNHGLEGVMEHLRRGGVAKLNLENNNLTEEGARKLTEFLLPPMPMGADACLHAAREGARAAAGFLRGAQVTALMESLDVFERALECTTETEVSTLLEGASSGAHVGESLFTAKYGTSSKDKEEFISKVVGIRDRAEAAELYGQLHKQSVAEKRRILGAAFSTTHPITDALKAQALEAIHRQSYTFEYILYCLSFFHKTHSIGEDIKQVLLARTAGDHKEGAQGRPLEEDLRVVFIGKLLGTVAHQNAVGAGKPDAGKRNSEKAHAGTGQQLTLLRLGGNPLGDLGALHVATFLKFDTALTKLYLNKCCIGDEGAEHLSEALRTCNTSLTFIDLTLNAITDVGGVALVEIFGKNRSLTTLRVDGNLISQEVEAVLLRATESNRHSQPQGPAANPRFAAAVRGAMQVPRTPAAAMRYDAQLALLPHYAVQAPTPTAAAVAIQAEHSPRSEDPGGATPARGASHQHHLPPSSHVEDTLFKVRTLLQLGKGNRALNVVEDLLHDALTCPRGAERCRGRQHRHTSRKHHMHSHAAKAKKRRPGRLDGYPAADPVDAVDGDSDGGSTAYGDGVLGSLADGGAGVGVVTGEGSPFNTPPDDDRYLKRLLKKVQEASHSPDHRKRHRQTREQLHAADGEKLKGEKESGVSATYTPYYKAPETDFHHFVNEYAAAKFEPWKSRRYQLYHEAEQAWKASSWTIRDVYVKRGRVAARERKELAQKLGLNPNSHKPQRPAAAAASPTRSPSPGRGRTQSPRVVSSGDEAQRQYSFDLGGGEDVYQPFYEAPEKDYHFFMNAWGDEKFVAGKSRKYVMFYEADQAWRSSNWPTRSQYITKGKETAGVVVSKTRPRPDSDGDGDAAAATGTTHVSSVGDDNVRAAILSINNAADLEASACITDGTGTGPPARHGSGGITSPPPGSDGGMQSVASFRKNRFLGGQAPSGEMSAGPSSPKSPAMSEMPSFSVAGSKRGRNFGVGTTKRAGSRRNDRSQPQQEGEKVVVAEGSVLWTVRSETVRITFSRVDAGELAVPPALGPRDSNPRLGKPPMSPKSHAASEGTFSTFSSKTPMQMPLAGFVPVDPAEHAAEPDPEDESDVVHKLAASAAPQAPKFNVHVELNGRLLGDLSSVAIPFEPSRRTYLYGETVCIEDCQLPLPQSGKLRATILRELFPVGYEHAGQAAAAAGGDECSLVPADLPSDDEGMEFVSNGHVVQFWVASKVSMRYSVNGKRRAAFRRMDFNGVNTLHFNGKKDVSITLPIIGLLAVLHKLKKMALLSGVQHNIPDEVAGYGELLARELVDRAKRGVRDKDLAQLNERLADEEENDRATMLSHAVPAPLPPPLAAAPQGKKPAEPDAPAHTVKAEAPEALPACLPWKYTQAFSFLLGSEVVGFYEVSRRMPDYITHAPACFLVDAATFYLYSQEGALEYSFHVADVAALLVGQDGYGQLHLVIQPGPVRGTKPHDVMLTAAKADVLQIVKLLKRMAANPPRGTGRRLMVESLALGEGKTLKGQVTLVPVAGVSPIVTGIHPTKGIDAESVELLGSSVMTASYRRDEPPAAEPAPDTETMPAPPAVPEVDVPAVAETEPTPPPVPATASPTVTTTREDDGSDSYADSYSEGD
eukprot:TRINITY_DN22451_c0_g1_i1.p1 TRINITY_DN22451_c0_g1~~TRINITY_DN22451_c0_g1_i1.p1  ORF type:complete len:1634 (+),score=546.29 TRINITY_DN22451_c0_g1_i1:101-5002(+)